MNKSILSDAEIRLRCSGDSPLASGAPNFEEQLQPAGLDVTVQKIARLTGHARIGKPYQNQVASENDVPLNNGWFDLTPGSYILYLNERFDIPHDLAGLVLPRSTLIRCGGALESGLWDPGFQGKGRLGLNIPFMEKISIQKDGPIGQIIFFQMNQAERGFQFNEFYIDE
ncbi:dCTP deaminase domain-containing protein [Paenarthrobacter nicotinovorans]|uniref:dCTP deaminase domain-containing protein n=1 Tax=Paenarthrobacter nicotinovorans TaxID=29320 RepID=UPI003D67058B